MNMTLLKKIVIVGVLLLCFTTLSYGGTITGSRTGASGSKVGTITGSRTGTITGSRTGTITGSRTGTITGSRAGTITGSAADSRDSLENVYNEVLLRLLSVVLNGGF
jgi:outer membrane lipoprotein SlyB